MATKVIDVSENKRIGTTSPIASFVFMFLFILIAAFIDFSFVFIILTLFALIFSHVFFQFGPRIMFYNIIFIFRESKLSPAFRDKEYVADHYNIKKLRRILRMSK